MSNDRRITSPEQTRKIFLGGINPTTSEEFLKNFFSKYGDITDCCVIKTSGPEKKSRGFGFVTFLKTSSVDDVMDGRQSCKLIIDDREVEIKRAISREDPSVEPLHQKLRRKVFVGGIRQLTEERIAEFFLQFGKIEETVIPIDKSNNNKKRGFAFVIFQDPSCVKEVVAIQNHTIDGVVVECKRATPQEKDMPRVRRERGNEDGNDEMGSNFTPIGPKSGFNRAWGGGGFPGAFGAGNGPGFGPGGYGGAGWGRGWGGWGGGWGGGPGWGTGGSGWGYNSGYGSGWGTGGYGSGWGTGFGGGSGMGMGAGMGASSGSGGAAGSVGAGSGSGGSGFEGRLGAGGGFGGNMGGGGGGGGFGGGGGHERQSSGTSLLPGKGGGGGGGDRGDAEFGSNYGSQSSSFGPMRSQTNGSSGRFIGPTVPYGAPYGSGGGGGGIGERGGGGPSGGGGGGFGGPAGMGGPGGRRF